MKLDLHGVKHSDVEKKVDNFIMECNKLGITQANIVTGKSTTMKKIVNDCLVEHGLCESPLFFNEGGIIFDL